MPIRFKCYGDTADHAVGDLLTIMDLDSTDSTAEYCVESIESPDVMYICAQQDQVEFDDIEIETNVPKKRNKKGKFKKDCQG